MSYGSTPDIVGLPGVHIECKRAEQLRPYDWMAQAERDSERFHDGLPAVFHRRNRQGWLVTMRLPDWMKCTKKYRKVPHKKGVMSYVLFEAQRKASAD